MLNRLIVTPLFLLLTIASSGQSDTLQRHDLNEVTVTARRQGTLRMTGPVNGVKIGREELFRAACCNLGESFTTNPSVDVSYSDAATGAKQIRLLGLSGTYVQMLTENLPNLRGAAAPYALDYVPGTWMNSIQVSKGASSVKNGYESITGQIDIEYLKPDADEGVTLNVYGNTMSRVEANAEGNIHLSSTLSTELLAHYQDDLETHDTNDDGFADMPDTRQLNVQNRWKWNTGRYLLHAGIGLLHETRDGGQTAHHGKIAINPYVIAQETDRYEAYMKHAFILNPEHGTNIAVMGNATMHSADATYGWKRYNVKQKTAYAQLMFESNIGTLHNLSAGLSLAHDYIKESGSQKETTPGIYAQYTLNLSDRLVAMAGLRADHSSMHGTFVTPRLHLKLTPAEGISLRLSAGKGYRTPHAMVENHFLLGSGRVLFVDKLKQEEAWNYGISGSVDVTIARRTLRLNAEYYYTDFVQQAIVDYESDASRIRITNLDGDSYSHTVQIDASYPVAEGLTLTAAYRMNDVKTTYNHKLMEKPLTSRYKALLTASYKTPLGLWQADVTLQQNGGGRLPGSDARFHSFAQLQAQLTRWFRHFSVYIGGENLTGFRQKQPITGASDPFGSLFEPTMVWGPVQGAMGYAGVRINIGKL